MPKKKPIYSMTGFGRGRSVSAQRRVMAEIKSVNNRYLDLQIKGNALPGELEVHLSQVVKETIQRGSVSLFVLVAELGGRHAEYVADINRAKALYKLYARIASEIGADGSALAQFVLAQPDLVRALPSGGADKSLLKDAEKAVRAALAQFNRMRMKEGDHTAAALRESAGKITGAVTEIEKLAPERIKAWEERLKKKMESFLAQGGDESARLRLASEVTIMADKLDISEEISRLKSHQDQFLGTLSEGGPMGKRLNFLLQEINREANTLSSKALDAEIVRLGILIKEENEKMRENVQNLE